MDEIHARCQPNHFGRLGPSEGLLVPRLAPRLCRPNDDLAQNQEESHQKQLLTASALLDRAQQELMQTRMQLIHAEALHSAGRLAAGVAHEIKNPLAILLMGIEYLTRSLGGDIEASNRLMLQTMKQAVGRADAIVRGLMNFSTPTQLELKPQDLNAVLDQSLIMVRHELYAHHVISVRELGQGLPLVKIDGPKVEQVFINLLTNAAHAMGERGTLTVRTYLKAAAPGSEDTDAGSAHVVAEVDDTGPGIPDDQMAQIFEPFFTTNAPGKGNGLGLAVARQIVDLHGGAINIQNRTGGGVRATVTLPLYQSCAAV